MKNNTKIVLQIFAAGVAGVALFALANAQFTATFPGGLAAVLVFAPALLGLAIADYSRPVLPLTVRARILRPSLPTDTTTPVTARKERAAA